MQTQIERSEARGLRYDVGPAVFDPHNKISREFMEFLLPLHKEFTPPQRVLAWKRERALAEAHRGRLPNYLPPSEATTVKWRIELPAWCRDQRNQMTGPADDAELVIKMLNSGAPGVMLDLEDSMANEWPNRQIGISNILEALRGGLTYFDEKRQKVVGIDPGDTVIWLRPRGLHMSQAGVLPDNEMVSASLFDMAAIVFGIDPDGIEASLIILHTQKRIR